VAFLTDGYFHVGQWERDVRVGALMRGTGRSKSSVLRALHELEDRGLIAWRHGAGRVAGAPTVAIPGRRQRWALDMSRVQLLQVGKGVIFQPPAPVRRSAPLVTPKFSKSPKISSRGFDTPLKTEALETLGGTPKAAAVRPPLPAEYLAARASIRAVTVAGSVDAMPKGSRRDLTRWENQVAPPPDGVPIPPDIQALRERLKSKSGSQGEQVDRPPDD
jgi:hypothetical protein